MDFRQLDAGGDLFAFAHREYLPRLELHHRVAAAAACGGHNTEQFDGDSRWRITVLVPLQLSEQTLRGSYAYTERHGGLCARLESLQDRLDDYLIGTIDAIPELAEELLKIYDAPVEELWLPLSRVATPSCIK